MAFRVGDRSLDTNEPTWNSVRRGSYPSTKPCHPEAQPYPLPHYKPMNKGAVCCNAQMHQCRVCYTDSIWEENLNRSAPAVYNSVMIGKKRVVVGPPCSCAFISVISLQAEAIWIKRKTSSSPQNSSGVVSASLSISHHHPLLIVHRLIMSIFCHFPLPVETTSSRSWAAEMKTRRKNLLMPNPLLPTPHPHPSGGLCPRRASPCPTTQTWTTTSSRVRPQGFKTEARESAPLPPAPCNPGGSWRSLGWPPWSWPSRRVSTS